MLTLNNHPIMYVLLLPHFTSNENEAWRSYETCLRSHSKEMVLSRFIQAVWLEVQHTSSLCGTVFRLDIGNRGHKQCICFHVCLFQSV